MREIYVLTLSLLIFSTISMAGVSNNDLDAIRELTKAGQFQQALEKHIWFHEESKSSPGMGGVRLSYAISAWVELGEQYPPALEALIEIRDKDKAALLSGKGSFQSFHDLSAINQGLSEEADTLQLFLILEKEYPEQAEAYYIVAEDLLIKHKKYDMCAKYIGDPIIKFEGLRHNRELQLSFAKTNPKMNKPHFLEYANESYIDGVIKLIEVLVAIEKRDEAKEVQKRAMSYFSNDTIKYAIQ